jgi:hypothetical protein
MIRVFGADHGRINGDHVIHVTINVHRLRGGTMQHDEDVDARDAIRQLADSAALHVLCRFHGLQ